AVARMKRPTAAMIAAASSGVGEGLIAWAVGREGVIARSASDDGAVARAVAHADCDGSAAGGGVRWASPGLGPGLGGGRARLAPLGRLGGAGARRRLRRPVRARPLRGAPPAAGRGCASGSRAPH